MRTADAPGAAFDGRVFLQLSSYWDKTVELPLVSEEGFKAGTTHVSAQRRGLKLLASQGTKTGTKTVTGMALAGRACTL